MKDVTILYTEWRAEHGYYIHNEYSMTDRLMFECFKGGLITGMNGALLDMRDKQGDAAAPERCNSCGLGKSARMIGVSIIHGRN